MLNDSLPELFHKGRMDRARYIVERYVICSTSNIHLGHNPKRSAYEIMKEFVFFL